MEMERNAILAVWNRIERALQNTSPGESVGLRPGASPILLDSIQHSLGTALPEDVRLCFQVHDGQDSAARSIVGRWKILSLTDSVDNWQMLKASHESGEFADITPSADPTHRSELWHPAWIPLVANGAGDYMCVDVAPGPKGAVGQMLLYRHDDVNRPVIAPSFADWLAEVAAKLEEGVERSKWVQERQVPSSAPPMSQLLDLLGRRLRDKEVKQFLSIQSLKEKQRADYVALSSTEFGYDLKCSGGVVNEVHVYVRPQTSRAPFQGILIADISSNDGRREIRAKLGTPTKTSDAPAWDAFRLGAIELTVYYENEQGKIAAIIAAET